MIRSLANREVQEEAIPLFLEALVDEDSSVRFASARGLGNVASYSEHVVATLLNITIRDADNGTYGLSSSLRRLVERFSDDISKLDLEVRIAILIAGESFNRRPVAPRLLGIDAISPALEALMLYVLREGHTYLFRTNAAELIGRLAEPSPEVLNALWRALLDEDNDVRIACARHLLALGGDFRIKLIQL